MQKKIGASWLKQHILTQFYNMNMITFYDQFCQTCSPSAESPRSTEKYYPLCWDFLVEINYLVTKFRPGYPWFLLLESAFISTLSLHMLYRFCPWALIDKIFFFFCKLSFTTFTWNNVFKKADK